MAESPQRPPHSNPEDGRHRRRLRWNQHIGHTTIRVSTVILLVAFVLCSLLYGYTSQRYGIVAPEPVRPASTSPRTVQPEPTYEPPSTTFSQTPSSTPSESSASSEVPGEPNTDTPGPGGTRSTSTPSTTRPTIPGLPGVEIPQFGAPTPTTPVPTR